MMRRLPVLLLLAASCAPATSPAGDANNTAALVERLRAHGLRVEQVDEIQQPFFTPRAQVFRVEGDDLQLFEYAGEQAATDEAARVSRDGGTVGTTSMSWLAPPHFFRSGRVIAIYLGTNQSVLQALTSELGPQFAGR